ncbi:MAG: hypothetical protein ACI4RD_06365 [Kiritimatiellia bacterium]
MRTAQRLTRRFARLRELLATADRPINELIDACSWSSISCAKRIFKARYNQTMRNYRAQNARTVPAPPPLQSWQR